MTSYRQSMKDTLETMYAIREASLMERDLTPDEEKRREEIAKKLPDDDFKKRYGDKWMAVKMATATKMMKNEKIEIEIDDEDDDEDEEEKLTRPGGPMDEATYSYKAATFNGNVVKGTGKTKEAARKDAEDKAKSLGSTIRKRLPEETELDEGEMKDLVIKGQDLETYAKKSGGIDKNDMMKVAAMLKKGNKSGAVKYAMGLDTDPKEYILNLIGEETELDEAKMSASQIAALKKAYEPMRGKKMSMDSGNKLRSIMDKIDDDKQALIQLVKADIPFVSALAVTRLISKHDMKGAEINKLKEEVELDEKVQFEAPTKDGNTFQVIDRDTKGMRGTQDKFKMQIVDKRGKVIKDLGSHASLNGAKGMAKNRGIIEEVEIEEASAAADARRAMRRDPDMLQRAFSKDDSATDDDKKAASKNIMMQMRKAQSLNGKFDVEFQDGKKIKIPAKMAIAVQQKYNAMRKPADKEKFQAKVGKSYRDMLNALKEAVSPAQQAAIAISKKERGEKPKKESILDRIDRKIKENKNG